MKNKKGAAVLSLVSNGVLSLLKLIAGLVSGSVSLLSEALHSLGDMLASLIAIYSVTESDKPADKDHQLGHGKFEDLGGFIEAVLIVISALFILFIGFEKIINKNEPHIFQADLAIYVMIFSIAANFVVANYIIKKGNETDSNALLGDGHHLMADVYSSIGVLFGLVAVKATGIYILDPIIAIMTGTIILRTGIILIKKTSANLLDSSLPVEDIDRINSILEGYKTRGLVGVKSIKTSKSGNVKNIILVIFLPCETTLKDTHRLCDEIENELEAKLTHTNVIIHAEPDCKCQKKEMCPSLR